MPFPLDLNLERRTKELQNTDTRVFHKWHRRASFDASTVVFLCFPSAPFSFSRREGENEMGEGRTEVGKDRLGS